MPDASQAIRALLFISRSTESRPIVDLLESRGLRVSEHRLESQLAHFVETPDIILIEAQRRWGQIAGEANRLHPASPVILITAEGSEALAVAALRLGVRDYLRLPLSEAALDAALERCGTIRETKPGGEDPIVGSSDAVCRLKSYMKRAALSDCTVLITGETGTGKELAAAFIHHHSPRRNKPFVCMNCAAIPDPLLESELFGHARGAYTGAEAARDGLLASAEGGTVLLDEIGDMSLSGQAKILRVIEQKEVSRLGGTDKRKIDVRFVAATNQDLEKLASEGRFRRDLYYRLNVARVELPPLRERRDDIPLLVEYYRRRLGGVEIAKISEECLRRIAQYDWPGNIRELKNTLEGIFLNCAAGEIRSEHLPRSLREITGGQRLGSDEQERLVEALCSTHWNKSRAAEMLHWSRMTLYRKIAKYHISRSATA